MNLFDCGIPYTSVSSLAFKTNSKIAILAAIDAYKAGELLPTIPHRQEHTAYRTRKRRDVQAELQRIRILTDGLALEPIAPEARITLPSFCRYEGLSLAALKTYITCFSLCRYSREAFRFSATQEEMAGIARLSDRRLRDGLHELEQGRLILTRKVWRNPIVITMLDPSGESAVELYSLGDFYRRRMDSIPVHDRYKTMLGPWDPRGQLKDVSGPVANYQTRCPFCLSRESCLQFDSTDEGDHWVCHRCGLKGDSARLWVKLEPWRSRVHWQAVLQSTTHQTGALEAPFEAPYEEEVDREHS